MTEHPINRISALAPIFMSVLALLAVANSYHHASHEDGNWHVWILMVTAQLPFVFYFIFASRHELRRMVPILITQCALWVASLITGGYQAGWS